MKLFYRLCWIILRVYLAAFCKLQVNGLGNVPRTGGMIIASNHVGAGDPPFIGVCVNRELFYLAKKELFRNFFLRNLITRLNAIPVDRSILDQRALEASEEALHRGYGLILFPEGTRSKSGELGKGKPGVGLLARQALVPVVPAFIENSRGFAKLVFSAKRLRLTFGEPLSREWIESCPDDKDGYRRIAEEVMARIRSLRAAVKSGEQDAPLEQDENS